MATYNTLREANIARQKEWGNPSSGFMFRAIEWAGEVGELADAVTNNEPADHVADEAADVLITADLLMQDLYPEFNFDFADSGPIPNQGSSALPNITSDMRSRVLSALNLIKKVARERDDRVGSRVNANEVVRSIMDVAGFTHRILAIYGFDPTTSVEHKFNATSKKNGFATLLDFDDDGAAQAHVEGHEFPRMEGDALADMVRKLMGDEFEMVSVSRLNKDGSMTELTEDQFLGDIMNLIGSLPGPKKGKTEMQQALDETPALDSDVWVDFAEGLALTCSLAGDHEAALAAKGCILAEPGPGGALVNFPQLATILIVQQTKVMRESLNMRSRYTASRTAGSQLVAEALTWVRDEGGTTMAERLQAHLSREPEATKG